MKVFFSVVILIFALPLWRSMDMLAWVWASETLFAMIFFFWGSLFLVLPAWLLKPKLFPAIVLGFVITGTIVSFILGPLSGMATKGPDFRHCGITTYTGLFYNISPVLTAAPSDDLAVRNQLCWLKKMIQRVPRRFENPSEFNTYMEITRNKLLEPENKFKASLPLIGVLHGMILTAYDEPLDLGGGDPLIQTLKFWIEQYTVEISTQDYGFWDYPYAPYIKFEYGIIEKNWERIVNALVLNEEK